MEAFSNDNTAEIGSRLGGFFVHGLRVFAVDLCDESRQLSFGYLSP